MLKFLIFVLKTTFEIEKKHAKQQQNSSKKLKNIYKKQTTNKRNEKTGNEITRKIKNKAFFKAVAAFLWFE